MAARSLHLVGGAGAKPNSLGGAGGHQSDPQPSLHAAKPARSLHAAKTHSLGGAGGHHRGGRRRSLGTHAIRALAWAQELAREAQELAR